VKRGLLLALVVALAWCTVITLIHRDSPRTRLSAHGLLHVAIAESCQRSPAGSPLAPLPPENPLFAGETLPYYFFFHRVALALAALLGVDVAQSFEMMLLLAAAVVVVVGWLVGRRLFASDAAGLTTSFLLFAGAHPQGPLVLLFRRLREGPHLFEDDGSYLWGLVHPLNGALRIGDFYGTLGPLISTFLNLTARPLALAALLVVILMADVVLERASIGRLLLLALAMTLCTLFNPIVGIAAAAALAVALLMVAREGRQPAQHLVVVALVVGAALAWPWCRNLVHALAPPQRFASDDHQVRLAFNLHRAVAMATGGWLVAWLAWIGRARLAGARRGLADALIVAALLLALATALLSLPVGNEDSLFHAALVLLAVPAAGCVVPRSTGGAAPESIARAGSRALLLHAAFAPMVACVLFAYVGRPALPIAFTPAGLARLPADEPPARLYAWIRANTSADAVFVQDPGPEGRTCAGNTSELPALTGRSLFADHARHYLVAPYREAPQRAAITAKLVDGAPLDAGERALLFALGRPIYVVTYGADATAAARRDAEFGPPLFEAGPIRVHRYGSH
jgi:hypothetical protein